MTEDRFTSPTDTSISDEQPDERPRLPYGSWPSPIRIDDLLGDTVRLSEPWIDGDETYWVESRPAEAGRSVLVRRGVDGTTEDVTHAPFDVRDRVHEYGGGSYTVAGGTVAFSNRSDGRLYRVDPGATEPVPITPEGDYRYADLRLRSRASSVPGRARGPHGRRRGGRGDRGGAARR